jgi:hypothetical protein
MHLSDSDFPRKDFIIRNLHQNQVNNKLSVYKKKQHPFLHLMASCLETCMATIPQNQWRPSNCVKNFCVKNS